MFGSKVTDTFKVMTELVPRYDEIFFLNPFYCIICIPHKCVNLSGIGQNLRKKSHYTPLWYITYNDMFVEWIIN